MSYHVCQRRLVYVPDAAQIFNRCYDVRLNEVIRFYAVALVDVTLHTPIVYASSDGLPRESISFCLGYG